MRGRIARLAEAARGMRAAREFEARAKLPRPELDAWKQARVRELLARAKRTSPFWAERIGDPEDGLAAVEPLDKATLMEEWDRIVTDPRLRLADVEAHLDAITGDELLHGEYRVMATGGTTGRRGVFVYDRTEWLYQLGSFMRMNAAIGVKPRLPRRLRIAQLGATSPLHMSARYGMSVDVGIHRVLRLDVREPLERHLPALERFAPDVLVGYPSALALLAHERPRIAPSIVATTSEVRTPEMTQAIRAAWDVEPFDIYGITETGIFAADCAEHAGMHVFEDMAWLEVEEDRMLVTPLYTTTLPLIRYAISDIVSLTHEPCACGWTFARITAVDGRADDVLTLPARAGGTVAIHPIALRSPLARCERIKQYRIVHDAEGLHVECAPRNGADHAAIAGEVRALLAAGLEEAGAAPPAIDVRIRDALPRDAGPGGKFKLVEAR